MRKMIITAAAFLLLTVFVSNAQCDDPLKKLGRGVANVVTCPFEITYRIQEVNNSDGVVAATTYGLVKGLALMCLRGAVGVYEVVSFPIPFPEEYQPILTDPEFFFENEIW